jgi:hypothetical protein
MRSPIGWVLPGVALLATVLAVVAGPNDALALPAAAAAIVLAGFVFLGAGTDRSGPALTEPTAPRPSESERLRGALRSGTLGREYVLDTIDQVERAGPTPDLPARSLRETQRLLDLAPDQFLEYVRGRVRDLEARS